MIEVNGKKYVRIYSAQQSPNDGCRQCVARGVANVDLCNALPECVSKDATEYFHFEEVK